MRSRGVYLPMATSEWTWVRGATTNSLSAAGRERMYVTTPSGWSTLERVILHFQLIWVDTADDLAAPAAFTPLVLGMRWMNASTALPDSDPVTTPDADYIWCAQQTVRTSLSILYGTEQTVAGYYSSLSGVDITARRHLSSGSQYRAVVVTQPLPAFSDGSRPYQVNGYQQLLLSRPA